MIRSEFKGWYWIENSIGDGFKGKDRWCFEFIFFTIEGLYVENSKNSNKNNKNDVSN